MSSHRPKSLSELNNVYDKALRAEKAIKESSSLLSTPETSEDKPTENIFLQLETKAAEAKKNQVFDPDITNIASDFLKRYAQPEKPKAAPKEIKRPAPTIQSVQPHVRKPKAETKADDTLNQGFAATSEIKPPVHRPAHDVPATDAFVTAPQTIVSAEPSVPAYAEPVPAEEPVVEAPAVEAPVVRQTPVRTAPAPKIDHTPRPNARVRITSSERSELMEEYMRVMSDEDDEPSEKKSVFSFFRKKKRDDYDDEPVESIYEDFREEEPSDDEEVPIVAFDSSNVRYEDEYSDAPVTEETAVEASPMNLYDYIEADFDYDEDEDGTLDISTTTFEKEEVATEEFYSEEEAPSVEAEADEVAETLVYPAEEESDELSEEVIAEPVEEITEPEVIEEAEAIEEPEVYGEDPVEAQEVVEAEELAEVQEETQAAEEIIPAEEYYEEANDTTEETDEYAPTAEMEFEDIFSVSDETKRSFTGGDWGGTVPPVAAPSYESDEAYSESDNVFDGYEDYDDEDYEDEEEYDDDESVEKKKGNIFVKILLVFFAIISLTLGAATLAADFILDVDSGNLISDTYRLFCAREDMPSFAISKGDLIVAKNTHVDKDNIYVYATDESTYGVGKVIENTDNALGEFLLSTETATDGYQFIKRDSSMGVVVASYGTLGTILSIVCNYGIFIAFAFILVAIGLIVLLVIISKKKSDSDRYVEENSSANDDDEDDDDYYDDGNDSNEYEDDEEYYSEYDTDGIEQGLFSNI